MTDASLFKSGRQLGMDIYRVTAEVVSLLDGEISSSAAFKCCDELDELARKELTHDGHVVSEATGNAAAVAEVLSP